MSEQRNISIRGERRAFEVGRFVLAVLALADQENDKPKPMRPRRSSRRRNQPSPVKLIARRRREVVASTHLSA